MLETLNNIDTEIFLAINGQYNSFWDFVMLWASNKFIWIPLYLLLLYFLIKNYKWKTLIILVFVAILITLSDQISLHLFKNIFQRLRPCHEPEIADMVHLVNNKCGGQFSFISSHAANTFTLGNINRIQPDIFRRTLSGGCYYWRLAWSCLGLFDCKVIFLGTNKVFIKKLIILKQFNHRN
jgi:membrane-associated phospholipid phosphatase